MIRWFAHSCAVLLRWLVFANVYIAGCAVAMVHTTAQLFGVTLPKGLLLLVFWSTLSSYLWHWWLTPLPLAPHLPQRLRWNDQHRTAQLLLLLMALGLASGQLLRLQPYWPDLLPVIALTFLYTAPKINWRPFRALRRVAVLKTAYLALVWTYVTAALPLLLTPTQRPPALLTAWLLNRFLLIYAIAFWFDYRDRPDDRQSPWLTIVAKLTERQIDQFFGGISVGFGLTTIVLYYQGLEALTILCLSLPMVLLMVTARRIARQSSEYWYYLYLDGLLMLHSVLLVIM